MAPMYYRGAKAAICVFDVTSEESFDRVTTWLRDLKAHADPNVVICLAGNKCDQQPGFDLARAEAAAAELGGGFFKTSALTGDGVQEAFESLSRSVFDAFQSRRSSKELDGIRLNYEPEAAPKGCC
ncbi:P-loop containing nucleoside triphosphate hydrolase protein [Ochromonadaceae sp. CCMP2298]|nr:P-loop containing nucleoside triphosphate hydrolase protein [Ochromonadaceae sp. CCMP2298]